MKKVDYLVNIGLETHVQLKTRSKIFCGCRNVFGGEPNTHVCPVCLGYPGTLPVLNEEAVRLTVITGLMLGSRINLFSKFDRKSYFYPDMPKNYQISQYDKPFCVGGGVEIDLEGGGRKVIGITRIHLEEDVGKSMHFESSSGVDFNRAGTPLMEIVSEPEMESPEEAYAYLQALKEILLYAGVSDCNLEEGNMRCDINCSVRPAGSEQLGTKTEIKNMNTFHGVLHALRYEVRRQIDILEKGGRIEQETLRWDDRAGVTVAMRSKEYAHDYRYFPEPDLPPVRLTEETVAAWRAELPEMPRARRERFVRNYGLPEYDAGVLSADRAVADFFEETARLCGQPKAASNWVMTEVLRVISEKGLEITALKITPRALADLIGMVVEGKINTTAAKEVFDVLAVRGGEARAVVEERGLLQVRDAAAIEEYVLAAIADNPKSVDDYRKGKKAALQYLVGQVMRKSRGKADPQLVLEELRRRLG